jgi:hypothetical protein
LALHGRAVHHRSLCGGSGNPTGERYVNPHYAAHATKTVLVVAVGAEGEDRELRENLETAELSAGSYGWSAAKFR